MAYNIFLDQFLMFNSQADAGNGLTRGLDNDLARRTYVPTKLDNELTSAILAKNVPCFRHLPDRYYERRQTPRLFLELGSASLAER